MKIEKNSYFLKRNATAKNAIDSATIKTAGDRGDFVAVVVGIAVVATVTTVVGGTVVRTVVVTTGAAEPDLNTESLPYWFVTVSLTSYDPSFA